MEKTNSNIMKTKEQYEKEFEFQRKVIDFLLAQQRGETATDLLTNILSQEKEISVNDALAIIEESKQVVYFGLQKGVN